MTRLALATLFLLALLPASAQQIPSEFRSRNPYRRAPAWVSAASAIEAGQIVPGRLTEHEMAGLHRTILAASPKEAPASPSAGDSRCDVTFGALFDDAPMVTPQSLGDLRRQAQRGFTAAGPVIGSDIGFYSGTPFTVLQILVNRVSGKKNLRIAYLLIPVGSVNVSGVTLCTSDPRYPETPAVGDEVLFVADDAIDAEGQLFRLPAEQIFFTHAERLVAPTRFRKTGEAMSVGSLDEVTQALHVRMTTQK
ncbi:MAG: hypothetical protein JWN02_384 [Acidobacteria bacterium]|nr:hypothetical protein [Acidobacteriota bacterium]